MVGLTVSEHSLQAAARIIARALGDGIRRAR